MCRARRSSTTSPRSSARGWCSRRSEGWLVRPPAPHVDGRRLEGWDGHGLARGERDLDGPASASEAIDLERSCRWLDEPEMLHADARIDRHLARAVQATARRRDDFADPIRRNGEVGFRWQARHALAPPPGDVGDEDVIPEMQLGFIEDPPPTGIRGATRPAIESIEEHASDRG